MTTQLITPGQVKQYKRLVEDAADKALVGSDKDRLQRLIENGDEFQARIIASIRGFSGGNWLVGERVTSSYTYPEEYKGPKPIEVQIRTIAEIFDLDPSYALEFAKNLPALPEGAEGWFAIPQVGVLAKRFFEATEAQEYCRAVRVSHEKIANSRPFCNHYEMRITSDHLRPTYALDLIVETQKKGDILIVAAQFGLRFRGFSTRLACDTFATNEFGLGAVAVACMLLTHPERESRAEQLHIDCAGDKFAAAGGYFSHVPVFSFSRAGEVEFHFRRYDCAAERFGSASAFLLQ